MAARAVGSNARGGRSLAVADNVTRPMKFASHAPSARRSAFSPQTAAPAPRAAKRLQRREADELAPFHSITSSASASSVGGMSIPSAFAVCRLMTKSNLLACMTGSSVGFAPLRMRPV
jgi:hypothetical protein